MYHEKLDFSKTFGWHFPNCVLSKLFSLLDNADLGPMAADGFSLLMSDSADVLNRDCHADVRIMYRQRFFSENSAKLVQGFNAAPQGSRHCCVDWW